VARSVKELPSVPATNTEVAFVAVTVNVDEPPTMNDVGFAEIVTVGAGYGFTVSFAVAVVDPPVPVAVAV
jgi:hypothetical protein